MTDSAAANPTRVLPCDTCHGSAIAYRDPRTGVDVPHTSGQCPDAILPVTCARCGHVTRVASSRFHTLPIAR